MIERTCRCGKKFTARSADVKRGWGKFCSKRCKAIEQEGRTHQYASLKSNNSEMLPGWDDHKYESGSIHNDKD